MRCAMELREQKQQRCQAHETAMAGAMWDPTAVTADSPGGVSLGVGQRPPAQPKTLEHAVKRRLRPGPLPAIFPAASEGSEAAL